MCLHTTIHISHLFIIKVVKHELKILFKNKRDIKIHLSGIIIITTNCFILYKSINIMKRGF